LSGQTFFFYGSLMDEELLEAVLGRPVTHLTFATGWLDGYVAETAHGYSFPTLIERRGERVDGIVAQGLTQADIDRIAYFEDTEYAPVVVDVSTARSDVAAQVYMATASLKATGERWAFDKWKKEHKPLLLAVTHKVMSEHYGTTPIESIDAVWHKIKAEIEAEMKRPVALKTKPRARTAAQKQASPRRAKRAASPTRPPRGS
jgi:hypothetical protein